MRYHPLSLQWLAGGPIPAGFPILAAKYERSIDAGRFFGAPSVHHIPAIR